MGPSAQDKLSGRFRKENGQVVPDKTHINATGAEIFGRMIAVGLGEQVPALKQFVTPTPAKLPPVKIFDPR